MGMSFPCLPRGPAWMPFCHKVPPVARIEPLASPSCGCHLSAFPSARSAATPPGRILSIISLCPKQVRASRKIRSRKTAQCAFMMGKPPSIADRADIPKMVREAFKLCHDATQHRRTRRNVRTRANSTARAKAKAYATVESPEILPARRAACSSDVPRISAIVPYEYSLTALRAARPCHHLPRFGNALVRWCPHRLARRESGGCALR